LIGNIKSAILGLIFVFFFTLSILVNIDTSTLSVNLIYPVLLIIGSVLLVDEKENLLVGIFIGLSVVLFLGWYRFFTLEGGLMSEHLLGYWGLKYTPATRNNDALIPLLVYCLSTSIMLEREKYSLPYRSIVFIIFCAALIALILSYSRSTWVSAIIYTLIIFGVPKHHKMNWLKTGLVVILIVLFIPQLSQFSIDIDILQLWVRALSIFDSNYASSNFERTRLMLYSFEYFSLSILFGHGYGNFDSMFSLLGYSDLIGANHPENIFFEIMTSFGLPVTLALIVFVYSSVSAMKTAYIFNKRSILIALMVYSLFNSEVGSLFFWVFLGFLLCRNTMKVKVSKKPSMATTHKSF
jgi:hypothetical protein